MYEQLRQRDPGNRAVLWALHSVLERTGEREKAATVWEAEAEQTVAGAWRMHCPPLFGYVILYYFIFGYVSFYLPPGRCMSDVLSGGAYIFLHLVITL